MDSREIPHAGAPTRVFGADERDPARAMVIDVSREISRRLRSEPESAPAIAVAWIVSLPRALALVDDPDGALARALDRSLGAIVRRLAALAGGDASADTPAIAARRDAWLDALAPAIVADTRAHLGAIGDAWGELCGDPEVAARWADRLAPEVAAIWERGGDAPQSRACLSSLLAAGRHAAILALLALRPVALWPERRIGALAHAALGDVDAAIAFARDSDPLGHGNDAAIAALCESLLLAAGRRAEAYEGHALDASPRPNCLLTFRAIAAKYPERAPITILGDLLAASPGREGRWFATARAIGLRDLALEIAGRSPVDPRTLTRAADEALADDPLLARAVAVAALRWIAAGHGVEIDAADVLHAADLARSAAARIGAAAATEAELVAIGEGPTQASAWIALLLRSSRE